MRILNGRRPLKREAISGAFVCGSLCSLDPPLSSQLEALRHTLSQQLLPGYSSFAFVELEELDALLDAIVDQRPGRSNLCRILSRLPERSEGSHIHQSLVRGVERGWRYAIYAPNALAAGDCGRRFRQAIRAPEVRVYVAPSDWKPGLVVFNDLLVVGTFNVLADESFSRRMQQFAIIVQDFAGQRLLDGSELWDEIRT